MMRPTLLTVSVVFILGLVLLGAIPSDAATPKESSRDLATADRDSSTVSSASTGADARSNSNLRLEDITIEGDVDIPRVLFIESREHLRDQDFLHYLFLPSAAQLGREAPVRRILHWSPKGEHQPWTP